MEYSTYFIGAQIESVEKFNLDPLNYQALEIQLSYTYITI